MKGKTLARCCGALDKNPFVVCFLVCFCHRKWNTHSPLDDVCDGGAIVSHGSLVSLVQAGLSVNTLPFLFELVLRSYRIEGQNIGEVFWSAV